MNRNTILLIGENDRPEFEPFTRRLVALGGEFGAVCRYHTALSEAEREKGEGARLVFLLESRPGEFPPKGVARFRQLVPGAPLVLLAGPLCQGEGRTGRLPAGVTRFYFYEFETALLRELAKFFRHEPSRLALPATTNEEDFWREASFERPPRETVPLPRTEPNRNAVAAADPAMRELLADFASDEAPTDTLASVDDLFHLNAPPQRILIDLTVEAKEFLPRLKEMTARFSNSEFVIYIFAPTPEETALFAMAGERVTVLPKPFFRLTRPEASAY
ncbi:MAG: hypothetical protein J6S40_05255 [Thermoguttaceae bacterium]|nr:hypothetical protein [Thermoguttaceae bacterium]